MQVELLHALQLILMIVILVSITYHAAHSLKSFACLMTEAAHYSEVKSGIAYSNELTVVEFESYHKYHIWRFYLFS